MTRRTALRRNEVGCAAPRVVERAPLPNARLHLIAPGAARVRWSKVMTAQARIAVGFYDRPDVRACLADAVLRALQRH